MFFKKSEPKCEKPCLWIAVGMLAAFGVVACTKQGRRAIKAKMAKIGDKMSSCSAISS